MAQGARWHQPVLLQRLAGTLQILLLKVIEYSVVLIRGSFDVAALSHMGIFIAVYGPSLSLDQSQQMQVRTVLQKEGVPVGVDSEGLRRIILGGGSELVVVLTEPVDDIETNRRRQLPGIAFQLGLQGIELSAVSEAKGGYAEAFARDGRQKAFALESQQRLADGCLTDSEFSSPRR